MSSVSATLQKTSIQVNLANLGNTDQSASTGFASSALLNAPENVANNANARVLYKSYQSLFDLNPNEIVTIERIIISKAQGSTAISASSITNKIRVSKALVTAGRETTTPTITQASEIQIASVTTSLANVAKLEAGPVSNVDLDSSIGLKVGEINGLFNDANDATSAGLIIYNSAVNGEKANAALVGSLNFDIYFRKTARN